MAFTYRDSTITITIASTANGAFTSPSTAYDNATNKDAEGLVQVKVKTNASGTSSAGFVSVYLCRSADNGTTYDDAASGRAVRLGTFPAVANATTYIASFSTAPFGLLPQKCKVLLENQTGAALDSTGGNHAETIETVNLG
jgi:hypothetical protein